MEVLPDAFRIDWGEGRYARTSSSEGGGHVGAILYLLARALGTTSNGCRDVNHEEGLDMKTLTNITRMVAFTVFILMHEAIFAENDGRSSSEPTLEETIKYIETKITGDSCYHTGRSNDDPDRRGSTEMATMFDRFIPHTGDLSLRTLYEVSVSEHRQRFEFRYTFLLSDLSTRVEVLTSYLPSHDPVVSID